MIQAYIQGVLVLVPVGPRQFGHTRTYEISTVEFGQPLDMLIMTA